LVIVNSNKAVEHRRPKRDVLSSDDRSTAHIICRGRGRGRSLNTLRAGTGGKHVAGLAVAVVVDKAMKAATLLPGARNGISTAKPIIRIARISNSVIAWMANCTLNGSELALDVRDPSPLVSVHSMDSRDLAVDSGGREVACAGEAGSL
jgi:hypothetical protein